MDNELKDIIKRIEVDLLRGKVFALYKLNGKWHTSRLAASPKTIDLDIKFAMGIIEKDENAIFLSPDGRFMKEYPIDAVAEIYEIYYKYNIDLLKDIIQ